MNRDHVSSLIFFFFELMSHYKGSRTSSLPISTRQVYLILSPLKIYNGAEFNSIEVRRAMVASTGNLDVALLLVPASRP
jgi:hypothetical protein